MLSDVLVTGARHRCMTTAAGTTATSVNASQLANDSGRVASASATRMLTHAMNAVRFM